MTALVWTLGWLASQAHVGEVRCPPSLVDASALRAAVARELPGDEQFRVRCEANGNAGDADVVFVSSTGRHYRIPIGDTPPTFRPRTLALALAAAVKAPPETPPEGLGRASARPRAGMLLRSPLAISLETEAAWFDDTYLGVRIGRGFEVADGPVAGSDGSLAVSYAVSVLANDTGRVKDGSRPGWAFAAWLRVGLDGNFVLHPSVRLGPNLMFGAGATLYADGTIVYGTLTVGLHLGVVLTDDAEFIVRANAAFRFDDQAFEPGLVFSLGVLFGQPAF